MKNMRKILAIALALCLLPVMAMAAEEPADSGIAIQLNGETLAFPSGVAPYFSPEANRTFVPFRDLFEAMGAKVSYDENTRVVTAVRGETVVTLEQNGTAMQVTENGETRTIESDVPVMNLDGRVLVPIRFASEALGANVGWDQANQTVLVLDIPALIADKLGNYTLITKMNDINSAFVGKTYEMTMDMAMNMKGDIDGIKLDVPVTAKVVAVSDGLHADGQMDMTIDMTSLMTAMMEEAMPGVTGEMKMDINAEILISLDDLSYGIYCEYINQTMGLEAGTWLVFDMASMMEEMGEMSDMMAQLQGEMDIADVVSIILGESTLTSIYDYDEVASVIDMINKLIDDSNFVQKGNVYTNVVNLFDFDGASCVATLVIELDADGNAISSDVTITVTEETTGMELKVDVASKQNGMTMNIAIDVEGITVTLDATSAYALTDKTPRTAIPQGAPVFDLMDVMSGMY